MDLISDQGQGTFSGFSGLGFVEIAGGLQNIVGVYSCYSVEGMPEDTGQVEQNGLQEQDEGHPLVVWYGLSRLMWFRDMVSEGQVIGIPHPAVGVGIFGMAACKVDGGPAGDGGSHILVHTHSNGEHHQNDDGVATVHTVHEIIVPICRSAG